MKTADELFEENELSNVLGKHDKYLALALEISKHLKENSAEQLNKFSSYKHNNTIILYFHKLARTLEGESLRQFGELMADFDKLLIIIKKVASNLGSIPRDKIDTIDVSIDDYESLPFVNLGSIQKVNQLIRTKASIEFYSPSPVSTIFSYEFICPECTNITHSKASKTYCGFCKHRMENPDSQLEKNFRYVGLSAVPVNDLEKDEPSHNPAKMTCIMYCYSDNPEIMREKLSVDLVDVIGITRTRAKRGKKNEREYYVEILNTLPIDESLRAIDLSNEDIKQIIDASKSETLIQDLGESFFKNISGWSEVKTAIMLQFASCPVSFSKKMPVKRGNINIALVANPGEAKTEILRTVERYFPRSYKVSANQGSAAGIVAGVDKDSVSGENVVKRGAIFKCIPGGISLIDEYSEMGEEQAKFDDVLENNEFQFDKIASAKKQFVDFSCIAAMNPVDREWINNAPQWSRIPMSPQNVQRFDIVFGLKSNTDESFMKDVFKKVINSFKQTPESEEAHYTREFVIKYFAYARRIDPIITPAVENAIADFFGIIAKTDRQATQSSDDSRVKGIVRQLASCTRLTIAVARCRLRKKTEIEDFEVVKRLMLYAYRCFGLLTQNSESLVDVQWELVESRGEHSPSAIKRNKHEIVVTVIKELCGPNNAGCDFTELEKALRETYGFTSAHELEKIIAELKKKGEIFEPRNGLLKPL